MRETKTKTNTTATNVSTIPDTALEALARCLLPAIRSYFESDEGQREFAEWKLERQGLQQEQMERQKQQLQQSQSEQQKQPQQLLSGIENLPSGEMEFEQLLGLAG